MSFRKSVELLTGCILVKQFVYPPIKKDAKCSSTVEVYVVKKKSTVLLLESLVCLQAHSFHDLLS